MAFSGKIDLASSQVVKSKQGGVTFDDPPGYSPARWISPLFDRDLLLAELTKSFGEGVSRVQIAGRCSGAHTGQSFEILLIVLGGIGGGVLGAIGKDIWEAIKKAINRTVKRKPSRTLVEVAMEFEECDVILHAESRNAPEILTMFDDADRILEKLRLQIASQSTLPEKAETIELRANSSDDKTISVLYSYRRARLMMEDIASKTASSEREVSAQENRIAPNRSPEETGGAPPRTITPGKEVPRERARARNTKQKRKRKRNR